VRERLRKKKNNVGRREATEQEVERSGALTTDLPLLANYGIWPNNLRRNAEESSASAEAPTTEALGYFG